MKLAVTVLAIATILFGFMAIQKNRTETQALTALAKPKKTTAEITSTEIDREEELKERYFSLLEEYQVLHTKMVEEYNEWYEMDLEKRKRIRYLYPELELPPIEEQKLMFNGISSIKMNPTFHDVSKLEYEVEKLKEKYPNQAELTIPEAAPPTS